MHRFTRPFAWLLLFVFLLATFIPLPNKAAYADDSSKTVRVGYMLMDRFQEGKEGEYKSGYGYEYLQQIANLTGWNYKYIYGTFDELLVKLANGEIDVLGYVSQTPARKQHMLFTEFPQGREFFSLYTVDDPAAKSPNFPAGRTIGVIDTSYHQTVLTRWLTQEGIHCNIKTYKSAADMYDDLNAGVVDGIASSDYAVKHNYLPVTRLGFENFYLAVSKSRQDLYSDLVQAEQHIFNNNRSFNTNLYTKYYSDMKENTSLTTAHKQWLKEHNYTIRLGYLTNNRPYAFTNSKGALEGMMANLAKIFEEDYGITVEASSYDRPQEMYDAAKAGEIDVYGPLYADYYLGECKHISTTDPILSTRLMMLHRDPNLDFSDMRIAYAKGNAVQQSILQVNYPTHTTIEYPEKRTCLKAVKNGDADCLLLSTASMNYYKKFDEFKALTVTEMEQEIGVCLGVNQGQVDLLSLVNTVIHAAENRLGAASFIESSAADITVLDFMREHSLGIMFLLFIVIVALLSFIVYYQHTSSTIVQMKSDNATLSIQAFRDELTKVGNRAAYLEEETQLDEQIKDGSLVEFGAIVVDINGLKIVNDNYGHELGDTLIKNACHAICEVFKKSPVYRVGGDEFVVILQNDDFHNRDALIHALRERCSEDFSEEAVKNGAFSMALGTAIYNDAKDHSVLDVLKRADYAMYNDKESMKQS